MRAIVVVHDGRIVGESGEGFNASTPLLGWSMTKTVNAALAGMAIKDGKFSLDRKKLFSQWAGDARAEISVADLMAMTSGLECDEGGNSPDPGRLENLARDAAAFARDRALVAPPGTKFNYSGGSSVLLARLWQNAIGAEARAYPRERLFKPLGMTSAVLESDPSGTFLGEGFLYASAHDWARFGEFLRLGGEWIQSARRHVHVARAPPTGDHDHPFAETGDPTHGTNAGRHWLQRRETPVLDRRVLADQRHSPARWCNRSGRVPGRVLHYHHKLGRLAALLARELDQYVRKAKPRQLVVVRQQPGRHALCLARAPHFEPPAA